MSLKLAQLEDGANGRRLGLVRGEDVIDLTSIRPDLKTTLDLLEATDGASLPEYLEGILHAHGEQIEPRWTLQQLSSDSSAGGRLQVPIDAPEVWAAGVTYERSRDAREGESEGWASFYRKVYHAERPELFIKTSGMRRTAHPHEAIAVRSDSKWTVPEAELGVALRSDGSIIGYTIGNDVTARDIEGENPLYLPQAKIYSGCCTYGPTLLLEDGETEYTDWTISVTVSGPTSVRWHDEVSLTQLRRPIESLIDYLLRDNQIPTGTVLLTGTGMVPGDDISLNEGDRVDIAIGPIGVLSNPVLSL